MVGKYDGNIGGEPIYDEECPRCSEKGFIGIVQNDICTRCGYDFEKQEVRERVAKTLRKLGVKV